jgi:RimJ/RimL family protein N-acetyltransferase
MFETNITIETDRLLLRRYQEYDLQDLYEYLSDEDVVKYEPYKPMCLHEVKKELIQRIETEEMIAVVEKTSNKLIGNIYLGKRDFESLEIGYVFNKQYWHQHYAQESCNALIQKAFSEGIHRIYAECDPCNISSWRLLESLGFVREAHFRQNVYFWKDDKGNPIWKDTFVYSLLNQ